MNHHGLLLADLMLITEDQNIEDMSAEIAGQTPARVTDLLATAVRVRPLEAVETQCISWHASPLYRGRCDTGYCTTYATWFSVSVRVFLMVVCAPQSEWSQA